MKTSKLIEKLEDFFDLSKKKQHKKRDKLAKIIRKLEHKKSKLEKEMAEHVPGDETDIRNHELAQELKVVNGLIEKAQEGADSAPD